MIFHILIFKYIELKCFVDMPTEHVLELFMRVLEGIVCVPATPGGPTLSDLNDDFVSHLSLLSLFFSPFPCFFFSLVYFSSSPVYSLNPRADILILIDKVLV